MFFENKYKRLEKYGGVINEKILLQLIKELKNKNGKKHKKYYKKYTTPQMYINQKQKYYAHETVVWSWSSQIIVYPFSLYSFLTSFGLHNEIVQKINDQGMNVISNKSFTSR